MQSTTDASAPDPSHANGHASAVRLLLDAGADPAAAECDGCPYLHWAVRGGHAATVRAILAFRDDAGVMSGRGLPTAL